MLSVRDVSALVVARFPKTSKRHTVEVMISALITLGFFLFVPQAGPTGTVLDDVRAETVARGHAYEDRRLAEQLRLNALIERSSGSDCQALATAARGLILGALDAEFLMGESMMPAQTRVEELLADEEAVDVQAALVLIRFRDRMSASTDETQAEVVGRMLRQGRDAERQAEACASRNR